jgi:hypothetical protein
MVVGANRGAGGGGTPPVGTERRAVRRTYARVLLVEAVIIVALWLFGRAFN